jgi:predicted esterase YcpF (UPF0227 family)
MKVAFFHGLESPHRSEKNEILDKYFDAENVYAPAMDYKDPELFNSVLQHLQENPVDLLIGSSMGGYFAHSLSTILGTPTLLFNPALHSRSFNPENVKTGPHFPSQMFILGKHDTVIDPHKTFSLITADDYKFYTAITVEDMGHRIPVEIFESIIKEFAE